MVAVRYSVLPCPMGWFLSAGFPASLVPAMVMMEERASERLLTASRVMAMEWVRRPITALKAARAALARIPITEVLMMTEVRLSGEEAPFAIKTPFCLYTIQYRPYTGRFVDFFS